MPVNRNKFFFEKHLNTNVNLIPSVETISLSFNNKDKGIVLLGLSALYLITRVKPTLLTKCLSKRRNSRSELVGCSVLLKKKCAVNFLTYLNLIVFSGLTDFSGFSIKKDSFESGLMHITINNLLVFPELNRELDKFYTLKNLTITLKFKHKNYLSYSLLGNFPVKM